MTLYNIPLSGNCHKIRLLLSFLGLDYASHDLDLSNAEQKSDAYLQRNPFGQAPVLDDDGIIIRDSQATNEITHGPALLRAHHLFGREVNQTTALATTQKVLRIINAHLKDQTWLVGSAISIADIAIYPYIALAHQGKIDISSFANITTWCARIEALPNYTAMPGIHA